jgi:hypothetical protein
VAGFPLGRAPARPKRQKPEAALTAREFTEEEEHI